jgi:hypothetical protein
MRYLRFLRGVWRCLRLKGVRSEEAYWQYLQGYAQGAGDEAYRVRYKIRRLKEDLAMLQECEKARRFVADV